MFALPSLMLFGGLAAGSLQSAASEQRFDGPALVCGETFALRLAAGEHAVRRDPGIDFITYRVEGRDGRFLLYEGNAPQPSDDRIETGRNWPSVIAIHDNRSQAARTGGRVRDRLLLGRDQTALCPEHGREAVR